MSFFWSKPVPKNVVFSCYPFEHSEKTIFTQPVMQLPPATVIKTIRKCFQPTQAQWTENIRNTLNNKDLSKVVLARCCVLECERAPDPFAIASSLLSIAKNSIVFCFANERSAFVGATPELLFSRCKREITCEAVAGTTPLNKILGEKEQREILPVIEYIQKKLLPFCITSLLVSPLNVRQTSHVQHFCATLKGTLKASVTDEEIIQQLHPTPALCGVPKKQAFDWIQKCEPFKRGFYGGILGWSTQDESEWAIGIRSCLIQGTTVKLYTGAGIVAGSDPLLEWEELDQKMNLYRDIFV